MSVSSRCGVVLAGAFWMWAQQTAPNPRSPATRSARKKKVDQTALLPPLLLIDASAEAGGRPALGLTAADFQVSLNGQPAKVTGVYLVNAENGTISPSSTRIALKPDQVHRTIVFVADDLGLSVDGAQNVRRTLTRFLNEQMRPTDLVSIVRTASGTGAMQRLTGNKGELEAAIQAVQYNPVQGRSEAFASGARGALRVVLDSLHAQMGRKAVVLFTENTRLLEKPAPDTMPASANSGTSVVSVIDVRGASVPSLAEPGIAALAAKTGGRFLTHTDDLSGALASILQDQQSYYLVSYDSPLADTSGLMVQYPDLTTSRSGVVLRARKGVAQAANFTSDAVHDLWRPSFTTPAADLRRGLTDAFESGRMPIRFVANWALGKSGSEVDGHVFIDPRDLTYTNWLNGKTTCTLDIQIAAFNENGLALQSDSRTYVLQLNTEKFRESETRGFSASPSIALRTVGPYQIRIAVRDETSGRVGSASQFIEAPDMLDGHLAIGNVTASAVDENRTTLATQNLFHAGRTYKYVYQVLNLQSDQSKRSQMEAQSRILRDGQTVFQGPLATVSFSPSEDPKRRAAETELKLGQLEPGFYFLEFRVTDKLAKEPRTATQYTRFEVQ